MKCLVFIILAALGKLIKKFKRSYYQFYNLQYLRWKGAIVGSNCQMEGKMVLTISPNSKLKIGNNFICRSGFGGHILVEDISGLHIYGGGIIIGNNTGMSATNINCVNSVISITDASLSVSPILIINFPESGQQSPVTGFAGFDVL